MDNVNLEVALTINDQRYCKNCKGTIFQVYYSDNICKCEDCKAEYLIQKKDVKKKNLINHQR